MFARIGGQDVDVVAASYNEALDAAPDFNITIEAKAIANWRNLYLENVALFYRGEKMASGLIIDTPQLQLTDGKNQTIALGCAGELGRLTCYRAKSTAHYQNQLVTAILGDLMNMTSGAFALTNTSTMPDTSIKTTLDLRSKESLFAQIIDVIKATPGVHIRYVSGSFHEIHIGEFGVETSRLVQGDNLTSLKLQRSQNRAIQVVEAYGDRSGNRQISLADALANPDTLAHSLYSTYPISFDALTGTYIVTNTTVAKGCQVTKQFSEVKTRNDKPPTLAERREAGYALWLKVVRFLQQNAAYESYTADALLPTAPKVGDRAWVQAQVLEQIYNPVTREEKWASTFSVAQAYRIMKVTRHFDFQNLDDRLHDRYTLELSSSDDAELIDDDLELYERLERRDQSDDPSSAITFNVPATVSLTYGAPTPSDCDYPGGGPSDGKLYTINSPAPPLGATSVSASYVLNPLSALANVISLPAAPGDPLILCVSGTGQVWPPPVPVTVTAQFVFT